MSLECRSDLLLRARRGALSGAEELALRAHLEVCDSCRMMREIGAAFDEQGELELDDGARIARLAAHAKAPRRGGGRRASRVALLAACLSLLTGVAAATLGWIQRPAKGESDAAANSSFAPTQTPPKRQAATLGVHGAVAALAPAPPSPVTSAAVSSSTPARSETPHSPLSAAQLFRKANDARRAGQAQPAIQLYRSLQRDYPGSAEAALSSVSLGGLLLNRASAGAALEQFDHYLAASPGAALAAEALYGRARALQALGRRSEEKRTWEQLLARCPGCPYRETAKRRLTELR